MHTPLFPTVRTGLVLAFVAGVPTGVWRPRAIAESSPAVAQVVAPMVAHAAGRPVQRSGVDSTVHFRLSDQFGQVHDAADYRGRPLYVVGAGRKGRASATTWATTLGPLLVGADGQPLGAIVAVANLDGVPGFLRGLIRRRFPSDRRRAVLLDWDGAVTRRLAFDPARSTILAVGADGRPVLRLTTLAADSTTVASFVGRAEAAMRAAPIGTP